MLHHFMSLYYSGIRVLILRWPGFFLDHISTVQHQCPTGGLSSIQSLRVNIAEYYSGFIQLFNVIERRVIIEKVSMST